MNPNEKQADLLRFICSRGSVPRDQIDGRVLRPLLANAWAVEFAGTVRATAAGEALAALPAGEPAPKGPAPAQAGKLSGAQESFLRYLLRQTGPVLEDHADGRVLRALVARGLVRRAGGWVNPTDHAASQLVSHANRDRGRRTRRASQSAQGGRAEALLRAVEQLEAAIPRNAEVVVRGHPAYADDVLAGLRRLAIRMRAPDRE